MAQAGNSRRAHRSATASGLPDAVPATTGGDSDGDLPVPRWKASAHARVCDDAGLVRISRSRHDASIASPLMQPSIGRRVGIRIVTFEACSGFTHVTARRIAQPPGRPLSRGSGHIIALRRMSSPFISPPETFNGSIQPHGRDSEQPKLEFSPSVRRSDDRPGGASSRSVIFNCAITLWRSIAGRCSVTYAYKLLGTVRETATRRARIPRACRMALRVVPCLH
jgi:hypothetical protein